VINIATIHHNSSKFMKLQEKYVDRFTESKYKIFCGFSNTVPTVSYYKSFDFSNFSDQHWARLDRLAFEICIYLCLWMGMLFL